MQPCGRDALNSWDLVPFLRGAEMYTAMCTGRACFQFYRVAVTKLRIKLYCFAAWQTHKVLAVMIKRHFFHVLSQLQGQREATDPELEEE